MTDSHSYLFAMNMHVFGPFDCFSRSSAQRVEAAKLWRTFHQTNNDFCVPLSRIPTQSYTWNWISRHTHARIHTHKCASWKVFDNEIDIIRICVTNFTLKGFSNRISNFTIRHYYMQLHKSSTIFWNNFKHSSATGVSLWWCVRACLRSCVIVHSTLRLQYVVRLIVCCSPRTYRSHLWW